MLGLRLSPVLSHVFSSGLANGAGADVRGLERSPVWPPNCSSKLRFSEKLPTLIPSFVESYRKKAIFSSFKSRKVMLGFPVPYIGNHEKSQSTRVDWPNPSSPYREPQQIPSGSMPHGVAAKSIPTNFLKITFYQMGSAYTLLPMVWRAVQMFR